jgi:CCR4-NOT transcription complex subunit 7/8
MNSGINFDKLASRGIDHHTFAEHFITSGLLMNKDMHWYGFHTDHDFAYLLRMLTGSPIPEEDAKFHQELEFIFPNFYDIKVMAEISMGLFRGSLASLSERLGVYRDDECEHQAGSDSKITAKCFNELRKLGPVILSYCKGEIFGLSKHGIGYSNQNINRK